MYFTKIFLRDATPELNQVYYRVMKRALIFSNGNLANIYKLKEFIKSSDFIICADGGIKYALKAKLKPDVIIGDLDSVPKSLIKKLERQKVNFKKFSREKDWTDFELAVNLALDKGFKELLILGFLGDRVDHLFSSLFFLAKKFLETQGLEIKIIEGNQEIFFIRDSILLTGEKGSHLSLIPIGDVKGINSVGLYYPLKDDSLFFGTTRGVSNVFISSRVSLKVKEGVLLAILEKENPHSKK